MTLLNYTGSTYMRENLEVAQAVTSGIICNDFELWVKFNFIEKKTSRIFLLAVVHLLYRGRYPVFHFFA